MRQIEPETVIERLGSPAQIAEVVALVEAVERVDGHRPLDDHAWADLRHPSGSGFAGYLARDGAGVIGYAQVARGTAEWGLSLVLAPDRRAGLLVVGRDLVRAALGAVADVVVGHGDGATVHWWVTEPDPAHDALAAAVGLQPGRLLHQMQRPLPPDERTDLPTRAFRVGVDEGAWLTVNNRAFAGHPEQGGWDLERLLSREEEPWFDAGGFRLHEREGRLAGFCWTKVHADHDPALGEIYVIAVDPDFHGLGLGRALTLAGLQHMAAEGVPMGMLYVDGDNTAAHTLYESLGFTVARTDRAYVGEIR